MNLDPAVTASKLESLAVGSVLMTLTVEDPDSADTHTFSFSCTPADGDNKLSIDSSEYWVVCSESESSVIRDNKLSIDSSEYWVMCSESKSSVIRDNKLSIDSSEY